MERRKNNDNVDDDEAMHAEEEAKASNGKKPSGKKLVKQTSDGAAAGDEDLAKQSMPSQPSIIEEDLSADFSVGNPEEKGSHIEYLVKGKDR